jgi:hypothetical protein
LFENCTKCAFVRLREVFGAELQLEKSGFGYFESASKDEEKEKQEETGTRSREGKETP